MTTGERDFHDPASDPRASDLQTSGPQAPDARPQADPVPYDPTGLDLARQMASSAGRAVPPSARPAAKPRRRTPRRSGGGSTGTGTGGDPTPLGEALEDVISERGWSTQVNVHLLLGRWPELVGPVVAEHSVPEAFRDGVVVVRTSSTNWAAQLRLMAPQMLAKMNQALGDQTIRRVQIVGPQAPSWKHGPRSVRGPGPRDTYG